MNRPEAVTECKEKTVCFFKTNRGGRSHEDTAQNQGIESVADAEAYLTSGMESSDLTAEVKIPALLRGAGDRFSARQNRLQQVLRATHAPACAQAEGGYRLQVGTGLSRNLLADAFEVARLQIVDDNVPDMRS